jgi:aldehyde dehydrogenase (NAD+)
MNNLLEKLKIEKRNPGGCIGSGGWIVDPGGTELASYNPANGEPIAHVVQAGDQTYEKVVQSAHESFLKWRLVPAPKRGLVLRDLTDALREFQEPLGELVSLEMGKIRGEGIGEVQEMIDISDFAVGLSRQLYGLTMHSERSGHRMFEQWHPLGTVGIITSFNFPVAVWSWNAAIAAVCGDTMVWKPSSLTPLTAIAVQHIVNSVTGDHQLSGVFNLLIGGGGTIGERMINDQRLPLISFTGSVSMGKHVAETVARRLGRSILELGGNNGAIITEDADLELATRAILFGALGTSGQRCTTTRRLIVHRKVAAEFTGRLIHAYRQVAIGDPLDRKTLMGPLVEKDAVIVMMDALKRAHSEGGQILYGGNVLPDKGDCFVQPAIVQMQEQTPLVCEETFAPILYILEYDRLEEAITLLRNVPQGLSSALFTINLRKAEQFLSVQGSDCGIANVNIGTSGAEITGAFGGEKETGGGREAGSDAWKAYMRRQTSTINWSGSMPLAQGIHFGD